LYQISEKLNVPIEKLYKKETAWGVIWKNT
jgi:hypothetical protein